MTHVPETRLTLKSVLERSAQRFGEKTAIAMGEQRISFHQLDADANRIARSLATMGVQKGDRVATMQGSNPAFVTLFFGIMKAGAIAVPLDSRYLPDELAALFADCTPKVLVTENPPLDALHDSFDRFTSIDHVITFDGTRGGRFTAYEDIIKETSPEPVDVTVEPDDVCIISYTGGPTLEPHGVALSHGPVCVEAIDSADTFRQTQDDVLIQFALPTYHQFGLTAVLLASIERGNTVIEVPGTGRSIDSFMETVEREKGTIYMGVPYIYSLMVNVARREGVRHDLSSLRCCASAGAPLEVAVIEQFKKYYGMNLIDMYGQTESICQVTMMPLDGSGPVGSSGKPMSKWQLKIFDDADNEVPPGTEGEIVLRGPVMTGFHNHPEATAAALRNGWLHTGDIGYVDRDGFLFITARKRRMIILKGQNIFPSDIEAVIATHPDVAAVMVLGVPDLVRGETIKALVRVRPGSRVTEQDIRHYCQGKMADYKLPRDVEFVDVMPDDVPVWKRPSR